MRLSELLLTILVRAPVDVMRRCALGTFFSFPIFINKSKT